jgi:UDP-N-acetylglucosamine--N-acetylmuramyl-(pentapeptide) pyrophosphoryl-undecaprenol N-acetylglucosamine transferase
MPDVYAAADIVVGRSGAGTLWESAALGKPMVLIPLCGSGTRGDQVDNALNAQAAGAAVALIGPEASARNVCDAIMRILDDKARYRAMSLASGNLSRGNAALSIATEIREFILKGGKT